MERKNMDKSQMVVDAIIQNAEHIDDRLEILEKFVNEELELCQTLCDRLDDEQRNKRLINVINSIDKEYEIERLMTAFDRVANLRKRRRLFVAVSSVAAALLFVSFLVWFLDKNVESNLNLVQNSQEEPVHPRLILSSGVSYDLVSNSDHSNVVDQQYILTKNSKINLNKIDFSSEDSTHLNSAEGLFFEIVLPEKISYTVVLPDSTEVTLNANSRLKYPRQFSADKREVFIEGEAFFNVTKSDTPFIVNVYDNYVKVYGTKFNIKARHIDNVRTLLVEGVIGVGSKDIKEHILKPNQMAVINGCEGSYKVVDADPASVIGWLSGSIRCIDDSISTLIDELSNWYGVDIRYKQGELDGVFINVSIKQNMSLNEAFKLIENISDVKFINEGGYYSVNKTK